MTVAAAMDAVGADGCYTDDAETLREALSEGLIAVVLTRRPVLIREEQLALMKRATARWRRLDLDEVWPNPGRVDMRQGDADLVALTICQKAYDDVVSGRVKTALRKAGVAIAEAYTSAERMQDLIGQAHREAEDLEIRRHLALAGEHYRAMRDEIVKAAGI
jgi:hypothetical protein